MKNRGNLLKISTKPHNKLEKNSKPVARTEHNDYPSLCPSDQKS